MPQGKSVALHLQDRVGHAARTSRPCRRDETRPQPRPDPVHAGRRRNPLSPHIAPAPRSVDGAPPSRTPRQRPPPAQIHSRQSLPGPSRGCSAAAALRPEKPNLSVHARFGPVPWAAQTAAGLRKPRARVDQHRRRPLVTHAARNHARSARRLLCCGRLAVLRRRRPERSEFWPSLRPDCPAPRASWDLAKGGSARGAPLLRSACAAKRRASPLAHRRLLAAGSAALAPEQLLAAQGALEGGASFGAASTYWERRRVALPRHSERPPVPASAQDALGNLALAASAPCQSTRQCRALTTSALPCRSSRAQLDGPRRAGPR